MKQPCISKKALEVVVKKQEPNYTRSGFLPADSDFNYFVILLK